MGHTYARFIQASRWGNQWHPRVEISVEKTRTVLAAETLPPLPAPNCRSLDAVAQPVATREECIRCAGLVVR
jgi:hypothetical protein